MLIIEERAIYTTKELAEILKMNPVTIERKIKRKEIKASRIGREYRILGKDILLLFEWKKRFNNLMGEIESQIKEKDIRKRDVISALEEIRGKSRA